MPITLPRWFALPPPPPEIEILQRCSLLLEKDWRVLVLLARGSSCSDQKAIMHYSQGLTHDTNGKCPNLFQERLPVWWPMVDMVQMESCQSKWPRQLSKERMVPMVAASKEQAMGNEKSACAETSDNPCWGSIIMDPEILLLWYVWFETKEERVNIWQSMQHWQPKRWMSMYCRDWITSKSSFTNIKSICAKVLECSESPFSF
jgi:hypothetical protein